MIEKLLFKYLIFQKSILGTFACPAVSLQPKRQITYLILQVSLTLCVSFYHFP